jgi:hypothetical protein
LTSISGKRDMLTDFKFQRVIRGAAAAIPVVRDFIDTKNLSLRILSQARVNRVGIFLLDTRRAGETSLRKELHVLANSK